MRPASPPPPRRIFLISFNKCGTGSFYRLFRRNRISALHHHLPAENNAVAARDPAVSLALNMTKNFMLARDPLTNIDGYVAYTDLNYYVDGMFYEGGRLYPFLHEHYPDSYFILATRNVEAWLLSRLSHGGGSFAARAASALGGISHDAVAALWRQQFLAHNAEARRYFGRHSQARFLEFDIEQDDPARIATFLQPDFAIDIAHWGRSNVTSDVTRERAEQRRQDTPA